MGNWASQHAKLIRSRTTLSDNSRKTRRDTEEIHKSKSFNELNRRSSVRNGHTRAITRSSSNARSLVVGSSSMISSRSLSYQRSFRKDPSHPISNQGREIIVNCFENPHNDLATRICMRVFERRSDYQRFIYALGKDRWPLVTNKLRDFLEEVVLRINDLTAIERVSRKYGEEHVELKPFGFKPDFWVSLADAMTVECVILDMANHQPTDTVAAWSQLVTLMFSSVRDGYYAALRHQRKSSRRLLQRQSTVESNELSPNISQDTSTETSYQFTRPASLFLMSSHRQDSVASSNSCPITIPSISVPTSPVTLLDPRTLTQNDRSIST
uniref:Globin family profile domain-containing protein n=2 Tax=Ascaris TaxID=6251 RepID=F1LBP5_ASCSU